MNNYRNSKSEQAILTFARASFQFHRFVLIKEENGLVKSGKSFLGVHNFT